jgi:hypothetical protein
LSYWSPSVIAADVGGIFFPQREALGLDSREWTPLLVQRMVYAAAETRSFARAALVLRQVGGNAVSPKTIQRITHVVGNELAERRDAAEDEDVESLARPPEAPPELAVVQCDGGRIRTRCEDRGPGVHEERWRETKNACLLRMSHATFSEDPHCELPRAFRDPRKVAQLTEKEPIPLLPSSEETECAASEAWRPKRLVRTCLSSMVDSHEFGRQMERESRERRFFEAPARAFLGDGLPWNWSIQEAHFREFTPILDFTHALSYIYAAAVVTHDDGAAGWSRYLALARACWQGRVDEVTAALQGWLTRQGIDDDHPLAEDDPRCAVADAVRYLTNNRQRMDYPRYRREGLPTTSALMESLVKEINYRVKGTEMFWNDPCGAEAILQVRAAALCDDDRLTQHLATRPGCSRVRRPLATAA